MRHQICVGLSSDYERVLAGTCRSMASRVEQEPFAEGVRSFQERAPPRFTSLDPDFGLGYRPDLLDRRPREAGD